MRRKARPNTDSNNNQEKLHREPVSNFPDGEAVNPFSEPECLDEDKMFIECPGATVYDPETREIIAGVRFHDEDDPSKGYEIIQQQVLAPEHRRRRLIQKDHYNLIRRCQACQDLTVRLMRREGPDFFIPNPKFPRKKQLKPVEKTW
ncbi:MAG: hypothetical protein CVT49_13825 [candidate division Zixibacteria bacterium HGW-Zixibacteria-1]|nr:MAG: hypothetical protein CVT49_13825 [candidate division Zixibacteria bacterium HGW-Zixibacteria-1]